MSSLATPVRLVDSFGPIEFDAPPPSLPDSMLDVHPFGSGRGFTLADEDDAADAHRAAAECDAAAAFQATMLELDLVQQIRSAANVIGRSGVARAMRLAGI